MTQATIPRAQPYDLLTYDGRVETLTLELLGQNTSYRDGKQRWFEVTLYRDADGSYVVHTVGRSRVPGERDLGKIVRTTSAYEIVEVLTVNHRGETYVTRPSVLALAQAAAHDEGIQAVYLKMVA